MHNIYSYHAKFNPVVPTYFMEKYFSAKDWVLDPFCGSGTTLLVGLEKGINTVGVDLNPIAILNSKVKVETYSKEKLYYYYNYLKAEDKYLYQPQFPNKNKWFQPMNLKEMERLYASILNISEEKYLNFFKLVFLSLLNKVSRRRKTWNIGYIADNVLPDTDSKYSMEEEFFKKTLRVIKNYEQKKYEGVQTKVIHSNLIDIELKEKYDGIITSPPYPFAVDFIKYHRLALYWLEQPVDELSTKEVGARNKRSRKTALDDFYDEMELIYIKLMKNIKVGGYWCMTIGDTKRNKKSIKFTQWTIDLFMKQGWSVVENTQRTLKNQSMGQKRIPKENMLVLQKI